MRSSMMIRGVLCAAPLLLAACGGSESSFDLVLVHKDCEATTGESVLPVSGTVKISITGDGIGAPIVGTADVSSRSLDVPEVPAGSNRVATVEVCDDGATCNVVRAYGRSAPFEVSDSDTPSVEVQMFRVNGFTRTRASGGECSNLGTMRAGHTATLLPDGRVLIAGGFRLLVASGVANEVLETAEIFDPATGAFIATGDMCADGACLPRAFGQAVLLRDGRVLITGGVDETGNATATAILFDSKTNEWKPAPSMARARHGHTATLLDSASGAVVIVGGVDADGVVQSAIEVFERGAFTVVQGGGGNLSLPRAFHSAATVGKTGQGVQVVGGIDADGKTQGTAQVVSYNQASGTYVVAAATNVLDFGVAAAGLAPFARRLGVVGGASKWTIEGPQPGFGTGSEPIREVQWFDRPEGSGFKGTITGQLARISPCVAMLGAEDRALVVGGFAANGLTPLTKAEVLGWRDDVFSSSLTDNQGRLRDDSGRGYATCTSLGQGMVLVAGGIGTGNKAVSSAEIYVARTRAD